MSIKIPPGVFDVLPDNPTETWRSSHLWNYVEDIIRKTASEFGFKEIRTPIFERKELFLRSIGDETDIVTKEIYDFQDKGDRWMALRPEGTAPVMRSFIENHLDQQATTHKFFYIGPMFRYERAQAGRYRQHHQFGAEAIGHENPEQDVEVIALLHTLFSRLGLRNLHVMINSIGDLESRKRFRDDLKLYLKDQYDGLSEDSKRRYETNPLRILDSKELCDQDIVAHAPSILDYLSPACRDHFNRVQELLKQLNISFTVNPKLVRGLDYYNKTVFEVTSSDLGAQNSIGGGGRYDGLIKTLEGPDLPACGFGTGIERIIQTMLAQSVPLPEAPKPTLFLIALGDEAKKICYPLLHSLRQKGISCQMDFSNRKLGKIMHLADNVGATFTAIVGDDEIRTSMITLKRMATGEQIPASLHHLDRVLHIEERAEEFAAIWREMNQPFDHPSEGDYFIKKISHIIKGAKDATDHLQKAVDEMKGLL